MIEDRMDDPMLFPSEEVLRGRLGPSYAAFEALFGSLRKELPGFTDAWRYYRDGKSWLLKAAVKDKTIFWLSAATGRFYATIYLPAGEGDAVAASVLPEVLKQAFRSSAEGKKSGSLSFEIKAKKDLEAFRQALSLKLAALRPKPRSGGE